ncbi:MAG TPA: zinc-binding dehydrogenase [Candidatus Binatia bacterium]|nr:zinc-binding dehydrogenase [Candidatus Binatia bacterium]
MKAIQIERTGGPEVLTYLDVPTPMVGPGDVLVQAHAIGVNMPEVLVRRGSYAWMPPLPAIPGIEMSGVIVQTGADVRTLRVGQPVYVSARELVHRGGCYAEYIAVAERAVYVVPAGVDLDAAATLAAYQVAYHLLHSATRGFRYESVLVQAAAGGIGSALVQLARAAGKRVIALAGSKEKAEFARAQGATVAINYREAGLDERLAAATGGTGVDLILDSVGGPRFAGLFAHVAPLGLVVLYGSLDGWPDADVVPAMRKSGRSPALRLFSMHTFDDDPGSRRGATEALLGMLSGGAIRPPIQERVPLAEAARAQGLLESGRVLGKLVLKP